MRALLINLFIFTISSFVLGQSNIIFENGKYYFADRIIVKYSQVPGSLNKTNESILGKMGITEYRKAFNLLKNPSNESTEIETIYSLKFSAPYNPIYISKELTKIKNVEWAEPHYLYELTFEPDDPYFTDSTNQNFEMLDLIGAQDAWNINKGNEEIIIAIVDTGIEWMHEDLADNIWINSGEIPDNGLDDDGNGFTDDIRGWDFGGLDGTPDNDPDEDRADHGTHVAGLASAVTNNGIGISSIGFRSKIMAVKTSQDNIRSGNTALIAYGLDGILYAADNGAKIINCSWGGYSYSYAAQAVIDYAVSKGALVVAAAGNDNTANSFYPASYDGVLSVAGTSYVDQKAIWSNYGTKIDVTAPGVNIFSTWFSDSYTVKHGTSLSSPITAGLAALVSAQFPDFTPLQVGEQIRSNTDNINNINPSYANMLGSGRINSARALSTIESKSVRITDLKFIEVGDNDEILESGEQVRIVLEFTNYLNPVSNLNVSLSSDDPNISITKSSVSLGSMSTLQVIEIEPGILELAINDDAEKNVDINIFVSFSGSDYSDHDWISLSINPTYQIQTTENLSVTFNSSGSMGFDDYPTNLKGKGLVFKEGPNLMFEGALIYGNSANSVVNSARDVNGDKDLDFSTVIPISQFSPGTIADKETYTKFTDASAFPKSLGIETEVHTYSFDNIADADYIFVRYSFRNTGEADISDFYAGQYWDFDLDGNSYEDDMVAFDESNNFGYVFDDNGDPVITHVGLALLSEGNTNFFAMDNNGDSNPTISWDGFDDAEKWKALTGGKAYLTSGPSDISLVISGGPYTLNRGTTTNIDFVIAAENDLEGLRSVIERARTNYSNILTDIQTNDHIPDEFKLEQNYPNPFNPVTKIKYTIPAGIDGKSSMQPVKLIVFNILGEEIATLVDRNQTAGNYEVTFGGRDLISGVYFYELQAGNFREVKKMMYLK